MKTMRGIHTGIAEEPDGIPDKKAGCEPVSIYDTRWQLRDCVGNGPSFDGLYDYRSARLPAQFNGDGMDSANTPSAAIITRHHSTASVRINMSCLSEWRDLTPSPRAKNLLFKPFFRFIPCASCVPVLVTSHCGLGFCSDIVVKMGKNDRWGGLVRIICLLLKAPLYTLGSFKEILNTHRTTFFPVSADCIAVQACSHQGQAPSAKVSLPGFV